MIDLTAKYTHSSISPRVLRDQKLPSLPRMKQKITKTFPKYVDQYKDVAQKST